MGNLVYNLHYYARLGWNYALLQTLYRLTRPAALAYQGIAANQSYTKASFDFLDRETRDGILSQGPGFDADRVVVDVGGDTGIWSQQIYDRYAPKLAIFEPNPRSLDALRERFEGTTAEIFPFGLGSENRTCQLSDHGMGSSIFTSSPAYAHLQKFEIELRDAAEVLSEAAFPVIDLIKINIEGGEYDLLPRMIETGLVERCRIIRVQFHDWIPNAFAMRARIARALKATHAVEWSYPMVWESWTRRG